ncbi:unnamed protein product [Darwinula stevensoni]|uniref:DEP domain-containing protein n=1 Tax=Darwinula stevensoni TaxID=69355 RepID=A0A7R9A3V3_9CRUS|nr:unnamed protein product [Darwinula stevensoni]CAG0888714.1 unnamed protein product [Darwinula stevensoni]
MGGNLILNPRDLPDAKPKSIVEIYHPEDEGPRLLLQVENPKEDYKQKDTISIEQSIAQVFNLRAYADVVVSLVDPTLVSLDSVEVTFKDQYFARSDMWKLKECLVDRCIYLTQKIEFCGGSVVFRSLTGMVYLFIQMSSEMWDFDVHGDLYFEKAVNGFLCDLFTKWKKQGSNHEVTIVLFSRTFYKASSIEEFPDYMRPCLEQDHRGRFYEDFYRVAIQNERSEDWTMIVSQLKQAFYEYPKKVLSCHQRPSIHVPKAINSSASQGNFLEVLNISLTDVSVPITVFEKHYVDRSFDRTGQVSVVITPGVGVFEVDRELTNITKQRIIDNGVGSDLVCLGEQPLHAVPLFKYHNKLPVHQSQVVDDFSMPHWINLSFYTSNKQMGMNVFVSRVKIPPNLLLSGNGKMSVPSSLGSTSSLLPPTPQHCPRSSHETILESDFQNSVFDYDAYDAQVFKLPASQSFRDAEAATQMHHGYGGHHMKKKTQPAIGRCPYHKMSDADLYAPSHELPSRSGAHGKHSSAINIPPTPSLLSSSYGALDLECEFVKFSLFTLLQIHEVVEEAAETVCHSVIAAPDSPLLVFLHPSLPPPSLRACPPQLRLLPSHMCHKVKEPWFFFSYVYFSPVARALQLSRRLHESERVSADPLFPGTPPPFIGGSAGSPPTDYMTPEKVSLEWVWSLSRPSFSAKRPRRSLINPFDPSHVKIKLTSNRRRWTHIFPKGPEGMLIQQHHYQAVPSASEESPSDESLVETPASDHDQSEDSYTLESRFRSVPLLPLSFLFVFGQASRSSCACVKVQSAGAILECLSKGDVVDRRATEGNAQDVPDRDGEPEEPDAALGCDGGAGVDPGFDHRVMNSSTNQQAILPGEVGLKLKVIAFIPFQVLGRDAENCLVSTSYRMDINALTADPGETGVDWKSLTIPACLPITTDYFPDARSLQFDYVLSDYSLLPEAISADIERLKYDHWTPLTTAQAFWEMIAQRLQQGFQMIVFEERSQPGEGNPLPQGTLGRMKPKLEKPSLSSSASSPSLASSSVYLSIGRIFHKLTLLEPTITVTRYSPRHPYPSLRMKYKYRFLAPHSDTFEVSTADFVTEKLENYKWNYLDNYVATRGDREFRLTKVRPPALCGTRPSTSTRYDCCPQDLKYWRFPMVLLPQCHVCTTKQIVEEKMQHFDVYQVLCEEDVAVLTDGFLKFLESAVNRIRRPAPARKHRGSSGMRPRLRSLGSREGLAALWGGWGRGPDLVVPERLGRLSEGQLLNASSQSSLIAERMRDPKTGVGTLPVQFGLPSFTFVSGEAVLWVLGNVDGIQSAPQAVSLLQNLLSDGYIYHASGDKKFPFLNGFYLYYFVTESGKLPGQMFDIFLRRLAHESGLPMLEANRPSMVSLVLGAEAEVSLPRQDLAAFQQDFVEVETLPYPLMAPDHAFLAPETLAETGSWSPGTSFKEVDLEVDVNGKSDRIEWAHARYQRHYNPAVAYELMVYWVTATGPLIAELVLGWARKAGQSGFNMVPVPSDPFALPFSWKSDPLRGPIYVPLNTECLMGDQSYLFEGFPEETWNQRMFLLQEGIARRFGFIPCHLDLEGMPGAKAPNPMPQYIHVTGTAFIMIPIRLQSPAQIGIAISGKSTSEECGSWQSPYCVFAARMASLHRQHGFAPDPSLTSSSSIGAPQMRSRGTESTYAFALIAGHEVEVV